MSALVVDYPSLIAALKARRLELGYSQNAFDHHVGLPQSYTSHIETFTDPLNGRGMSTASFGFILEGLKAALVLVPRDRLSYNIAESGCDLAGPISEVLKAFKDKGASADELVAVAERIEAAQMVREPHSELNDFVNKGILARRRAYHREYMAAQRAKERREAAVAADKAQASK